jgi:hypothetical protein
MELKLCKDCKFYKKYWGYGGHNGIYDECTCPSVPKKVNPVDGSGRRFVFCTFERSDIRSCGPDAKYWEPKPEPETKEQFWSRMFNFG